MPRPGGARASRKNQVNHYRSLCRDVAILREGDDHCIHLPAASPARAAGCKADGGSPDQQGSISGKYTSEPRSRDVIEPAFVPRNKTGKHPIRRFPPEHRIPRKTSEKASKIDCCRHKSPVFGSPSRSSREGLRNSSAEGAWRGVHFFDSCHARFFLTKSAEKRYKLLRGR